MLTKNPPQQNLLPKSFSCEDHDDPGELNFGIDEDINESDDESAYDTGQPFSISMYYS